MKNGPKISVVDCLKGALENFKNRNFSKEDISRICLHGSGVEKWLQSEIYLALDKYLARNFEKSYYAMSEYKFSDISIWKYVDGNNNDVLNAVLEMKALFRSSAMSKKNAKSLVKYGNEFAEKAHDQLEKEEFEECQKFGVFFLVDDYYPESSVKEGEGREIFLKKSLRVIRKHFSVEKVCPIKEVAGNINLQYPTGIHSCSVDVVFGKWKPEK